MPPKNQSEWYLGVDLGTGSCKSIIVDETATVLGYSAIDYSTGTTGDHWGKQEPDGLVHAMIHSVRSAIKNTNVSPLACRGMSIAGALHSVLALDRNNKPLTGIITWIDNRAVDQAERVRRKYDPIEIYQQTGCPVHGMFPMYKIMWLRDEAWSARQRNPRISIQRSGWLLFYCYQARLYMFTHYIVINQDDFPGDYP